MRRIVAVFAGVALVACGRGGVAQSPAPTTEILSRAPLTEAVPAIGAAGISFATTGPIDLVVGRSTFGPGAENGWHVHPGPGFVQVKSGSLTMIRGDCSRLVVKAGQAVVERGPQELLFARNEGSEPTELYFTFLLPKDAETRLARPAPKNCKP